MRRITDQTLAGTNLDTQGERLSKAFLDQFCEQATNTRFPVHQQHDMLKPVAGYIENVRVVPDGENSGEWRLIGDVSLDTGKIEDVLGGFSISGIEMLRCSPSATALIYLPFPYYNDHDLIQELFNDPDLNVGKWIKKSAEPVTWVVLGSVIAFAITPIWDDVYKRKIAPRIDELLNKYLSFFQEKGLTSELVQILLFQNEKVEVRLIPIKGKEAICFRSKCVLDGLAKVVAHLSNDSKANDVGVKRIVLYYNVTIMAFSLHRIEYADGAIEHVV
jgi:hypothetical protein